MPDTLRWIACGVLLACCGGLGLAMTLNTWAIVDAVNTHLPESDRFDPLGWDFGKTTRLHHEYRRLCASGTLLRRQGIYHLLITTCVCLLAALLGFPLALVAFLTIGGGVIVWAVSFNKHV